MRVRGFAAAAAIVLGASAAYADGHVFGAGMLAQPVDRGPTVEPVDPVIPDQRALILHDGVRETLVIETAFAGDGTDFAWVVPTPSVPAITEAPARLFDELVESARPGLVSRVPDLRIAALLVVAAFALARHAGRRGRRAAMGLVASVGAIGVLADAVRPDGAPHSDATIRLGPAGGLGVGLPMTPAEEPVTVRQRGSIGAYDAVTLSARDPKALVGWLAAHGFAVPEGTSEVAAAYVRDGWVFNAMRLHRDGDSAAVVNIRPLAFAFDAPVPVYPMRLTGLAATPVTVDLFVAGGARADALGFATRRCANVTADPRHAGDLDHLALTDAGVRGLLGGARVVTRLARTFAPDEMGADVPVRWTGYARVRPLVWSEKAAEALAWNAAALLAIGGFIGLGSAAAGARHRASRRPRRLWPATALVLILALDAGLTVAALVPTVPTRPVGQVASDGAR